MQGTLSEFTMAELLQLFALAERTGTLFVTSDKGSSRVLLESGRVVGIGLEDFDVHRELLQCELLPMRGGATLDSVRPTPQTPGLSFIVRNLIEPDRWELYTRRCLEHHVYPYLSLERGTFEIVVERVPYCPLAVTLSVQQLVLDGSRWVSEMEDHKLDGFGPSAVVERADTMPDNRDMSSVEWLVWTILDHPQSIARVAERLGIPDIEATAAVRRLESDGLLRRS